MIIQNYPLERDFKRGIFYNGVIFDTCALLVFFLDNYIKIHPDKKYLLKKTNISERQINCLNMIIVNFKITKIIITPHILAEFLNKIRSDLKTDSKEIKKECLSDLKKCGEIIIKKDDLIKHNDFIEFGNDISLVLANKEQIKNFRHSCIISFDGRFIRNFFKKTKTEVLAFDLDTLQYLI